MRLTMKDHLVVIKVTSPEDDGMSSITNYGPFKNEGAAKKALKDTGWFYRSNEVWQLGLSSPLRAEIKYVEPILNGSKLPKKED